MGTMRGDLAPDDIAGAVSHFLLRSRAGDEARIRDAEDADPAEARWLVSLLEGAVRDAVYEAGGADYRNEISAEIDGNLLSIIITIYRCGDGEGDVEMGKIYWRELTAAYLGTFRGDGARWYDVVAGLVRAHLGGMLPREEV